MTDTYQPVCRHCDDTRISPFCKTKFVRGNKITYWPQCPHCAHMSREEHETAVARLRGKYRQLSLLEIAA